MPSAQELERDAREAVDRMLHLPRHLLGLVREPESIEVSPSAVVLVRPAQRRHWTRTRAFDDGDWILDRLAGDSVVLPF